MSENEIHEMIIDCIKQVAQDSSIPIQNIEEKQLIVEDLGFKSLDVATLISLLEDKTGKDPFAEGDITITDVRTVGDIYRIYSESISKDK